MVIDLAKKYYHSCGMENGEVIYSDEVYVKDMPHHKFQDEFYAQHPGGNMFDMFNYWNTYLTNRCKE